MDASSSAGVSKGEVRLRKFAPDAGLAADSKFLLHWFGLSATKNGCLDEELPRPSQWTHFAKDTALVDADTQYVPESGVRAAEVRRHRWCPWRQPVRWQVHGGQASTSIAMESLRKECEPA